MAADSGNRDPLIGTFLSGRYRIDARIAAGGMSTVYRAFDQTLDRAVAIKVLHREISELPDQIERFRREARAAAALSHPNIVTVIDAGEDERHPYIVFAFVDGETLKAKIRRLGELAIMEAVVHGIEIGRALEAAHASKLIHRDVKPQNVLIDGEGRSKVTDFGIARSLDVAGLTATGRVLGTTDYVSPEQALGHSVDGRSDLYSLGIVIWEMLTGAVPFSAQNPVGVAMKHVRETVPDVQPRRPGVSAVLAAVVERATSKQPENRYSTAAEMVADLEDVLAVESARAGATAEGATAVLDAIPDRRGRRPLLALPARFSLAGALLALVLGGLVVAIVALTGGGSPSSPAGPAEAKALALRGPAATDYDPEGDGAEHSDEVGLAVDGDPSTTAWATETYKVQDLGDKGGVGLYVDAGRPVAAKGVEVRSLQPGWSVEVRGAGEGRVPGEVSGWRLLGKAASAATRQTVELRTGRSRYRYYLLWITKLAPADGGFRVEISNLKLFA